MTLSYAGYPPPTPPRRRRPPPSTLSTPSPPPTPALQVNASLSPGHGRGHARVRQSPRPPTSLGTLTWDPNVRTPFSGQVGDTQVAIAWATSPDGEAVLTLSIATPLPLSETERTVLLLDGNYPGIMPGSYVVIDSADPASSRPVKYPVIAKVGSAGHGRGERLRDHGQGHPADPERRRGSTRSAVLQSALRPLTVHAQPAALPLQPAPVDRRRGRFLDRPRRARRGHGAGPPDRGDGHAHRPAGRGDRSVRRDRDGRLGLR